MQRNIDSPSKFSCVNPIDKDLSLSASDQYVLVARMNIETSYLSFVDNEL